MDLKALIEAATASRKPIAREFEFEGQQVVGYFLELPAGDVRKTFQEENPDAAIVAATFCDAEGKLLFTPDQALALKYWPQRALAREALAAVGFTKEAKDDAKKPSEPTPG
jgi:hypothetical protein